MTNEELIAELQKYPKDSHVTIFGLVQTRCGDYNYGRLEDIEVTSTDGNIHIEGFQK